MQFDYNFSSYQTNQSCKMDDFDAMLEADGGSATAPPSLNLDESTWEGWINSTVLYAAQNPWTFLYYVLLALSPFFLASIILSLKLARAIQAQEKEAKRKAKREANASKTRRLKAE